MGKATKAKKRKNDTLARFLRPTPEREAHNDFQSAGAAVRVVPVIVRLHERKLISDEHFAALAYYRDQAGLADRSPVKSCLDFTPRGGHGPGISIQSALRETGRIERELGTLWTLTRAVAVDDTPIEALAVKRLGPTWFERAGLKEAADKLKSEAAMVLLELKFAAGRIVR